MKGLRLTRATKRRLAVSLLVAGLTAATPAKADPISAAILVSIGISATATAVAVTTFILMTVASLVLSTLIKLMSPQAKAQDRQASIATLSIGEIARRMILGEAATGGSLADAFNYGGQYGTDWEVQIVVMADHRCHSLTGFYVGDAYVPFSGDGAVAGYSGQLMVWWLPGTEDQVMPSVVTTYGGWDAASNLAGCATVIVAYKADDPKSESPIWTAGRPQFLWVVKGKYLYSPRKDSSVEGGSGPHRWGDPATWEWGDNLIDCRYNWQRGIYACDRVDQPEMLLVGRGLSAIEAPPERTFAAANVCDELVPLKGGGTERRYRCNFVISADEDFISIEESFAAACAGIIVQREGGVEIEPGAARSVVAEITDNDFIVGESLSFNAFKSDTQRINSVIPRYIEPSQRWADHAAPVRRRLADLVEDGGPREETLSLIAVTSNPQAQRCGEIRRRIGRKERSASGTLGPRFSHLEDGDWIGWTSARHLKGTRVVFRISGYSVPASWRNSISFEEISADCYDWNPAADELTAGAVAEQQAPPTYGGPPDVADWALSGATLTGDKGAIPALLLVGLVSDLYVSEVLVELRRVPLLMSEDGAPILAEDGSYILGEGAPTEWTSEASLPPAATNRTISNGIVPGVAYQVGISYRVAGIVGDRLILGPVLAGALAQQRGAFGLLGLGDAWPVTPLETSVTIAAVAALLDDGTPISMPAGSVTGLAAGTNYGTFWNLATAGYEVEVSPALTRLASRNYVFMGWATTSTAGVYAPPPAPPPGFGGDGPRPIKYESTTL